jgi:hypothetical protein
MMMTSWTAHDGSTNNRNNGVARTAKPKPLAACSSAAPAVVAANPAQSNRSTFLVENGLSPVRMGGPASPHRARIAAARKGSRYGLDPEAAAEADDKGVSKGGILEIEREGIVDDARRPGGRACPTFGAASLAQPGMDDLELAAKPFRRHRNPHAHRIPPLRLALGPHRRAHQGFSLFMIRSVV